MQTIKTAVVVVLLLIVFYGVYETLNRPPADPPKEVAAIDDQDIAPPDISFGPSFSPAADEPVVSVPTAGAGQETLDSKADLAQFPGPTMPVIDRMSEAHDAMTVPGGSMPIASPPPPLANANTAPANLSEPPGNGAASPSVAIPAAADLAVTDPSQPQMQSNPYVQGGTPAPPSGGPSTDNSSSLGHQAFQRALKSARSAIEKGRFHDALFQLSAFYKSPDLSAPEQTELLNMLDPLAAKVVYSREHLVESAYKVRRNETLMDIAQAYQVPWQLLQKINGIENPRVLLPNSELKVVSGPFRAEVDLQTRELTVFLGELYAGRFPITIGADPVPVGGEYTVRDKRDDRPYFTADGRQIPSGSPNNPFGRVWLDLGKEICIHGSPAVGSDGRSGCISLSPRDADDIYGILSVGSKVRILR